MPFSARKMHFFEKNGNLNPWPARARTDVKELFFQEVILHQFLKRKNRALLSKNVQAILTLLNLAQKVPFLEDLRKKSLKWLEPYCVCCPNTLSYMVLDHLWAKKCPNLRQNWNFPFFKNQHFWLFSGVYEVRYKFQDKL